VPANKQGNGPILFPLLKQCFQEVGSTEWKNIVLAHCPDKDTKTFENLAGCLQDYLKALARFLTIGNQLTRCFCTAQKPALMPTNDYMHHQEQLFDCVEKGLLRMTMELPMKKEKIKQIFFDAEEASTKLRGDT
jgi:hypothetical protein